MTRGRSGGVGAEKAAIAGARKGAATDGAEKEKRGGVAGCAEKGDKNPSATY